MRQSLASENKSIKGVPAAWAVHELAGLNLPDRRLIKRAQLIMTQFGQQPAASIPQACGSWGQSKAAYRFFDNEAVDPPQLLAAHTRATVQRMRAHRIVLALQDTTKLNHSAHPQTRGLGPIAHNAAKTVGLCLHTTLAVSTEGEPLGVLAAQDWARDPRRFGARRGHRRNRQPLTEKESHCWLRSLAACQKLVLECPQTLIVNVADREADIYELLAQGLEGPAGVHLLIRVQHNRQVQGPEKKLWPLLSGQPVGAILEVQTPRQTGRPSRRARLSIRWTAASLRAPCLKEGQPDLPLWAVEAREEHPPKGSEPILWRLLTTLPVADGAAAMEKARWYAQRWQIEVLHKVLKSGCQIQQRQLQTAARLRRALMMDLIVAWRLMHLSRAARQRPEASAEPWLEPAEWKILQCYFNPGSPPENQPPTLWQVVHWIGRLGGFLARKSDGEPGPIVLWRGLHRLNDLAQTFSILKTCG